MENYVRNEKKNYFKGISSGFNQCFKYNAAKQNEMKEVQINFTSIKKTFF